MLFWSNLMKIALGSSQNRTWCFEKWLTKCLLFCFYTRTQRDLSHVGYTPTWVKSRRAILKSFYGNEHFSLWEEQFFILNWIRFGLIVFPAQSINNTEVSSLALIKYLSFKIKKKLKTTNHKFMLTSILPTKIFKINYENKINSIFKLPNISNTKG